MKKYGNTMFPYVSWLDGRNDAEIEDMKKNHDRNERYDYHRTDEGMSNKEAFRKLAAASLAGLFNDAREMLDKMLIEEGLSGIDIVRGIHSAIRRENMPAKQKIQVIMALGDAEFRLVEGSSDNIQLDAMIARICYIGQEIN